MLKKEKLNRNEHVEERKRQIRPIVLKKETSLILIPIFDARKYFSLEYLLNDYLHN